MKKKIVMLCAVMLIACVSVFAASDRDKIEFVRSNSPMMSDFEKMVNYNEMHKNAGAGFALNALFGLGIGSYVQGDWVGGTIGLSGDLASSILIGVGTGLQIAAEVNRQNAMINNPNPDQNAIQEIYYHDLNVASAIIFTGGLTWLGFRIYQIVRPFTYSKKFNKQLKDAFGITQVAVVPTYTKDSQWGTTVAASFAF